MKGKEKMQKIRTILVKSLFTVAALAVTGVVGYATTNVTEKIETVEYSVERNERVVPRNEKFNCDSLDDFIKKGGLVEHEFYTKMYVKGYDKEVLLAAYDLAAEGDYRSRYVVVFTQTQPGIVSCIGEFKSNNRAIAKSNGMIFVREGDFYQRYGVTADGQHFAYFGAVKAKDCNPQPIVLKPVNNPQPIVLKPIN